MPAAAFLSLPRPTALPTSSEHVTLIAAAAAAAAAAPPPSPVPSRPYPALPRRCQMAKGLSPDKIVLVNLCGRGDKDMHTVAKYLGEDV